MDKGLIKYLGLDEWNETRHPRDNIGRFTTSAQAKISSVKIDFTRDNILPHLSKESLDIIGADDVSVRLKSNIINRNRKLHSDISDEEAEHIIKQALYNPEIIVPAKNENSFHFIARAEEKKQSFGIIRCRNKRGLS